MLITSAEVVFPPKSHETPLCPPPGPAEEQEPAGARPGHQGQLPQHRPAEVPQRGECRGTAEMRKSNLSNPTA